MRSRQFKDSSNGRAREPAPPASVVALDAEAADNLEFIRAECSYHRPGHAFTDAELVGSLLRIWAHSLAEEISFGLAEGGE